MKAGKGVSTAVSLTMLVPAITLVSVLLIGLMSQANLVQQAGINAADLQAEEGKKYLRASILRGPSNESLVNLYAAGKLPIHVDYLLATDYNGTVLAERSEVILSLNPGDNVTLTPGQLDPRLAVYDNNYWKMRREVKQIVLHTSDGNSYHLSWGPWGGAIAATFSTNTVTTSTTRTTETSTFTVTVSVIQTIYAPTISTTTTTTGAPRTTFMTEPPMFVSASCDISAEYVRSTLGLVYWSDLSVSCAVSVTYSGGGPPYSYTLSADGSSTNYCSSSGTASSDSFTTGCSKSERVSVYEYLTVYIGLTVSKPSGPSASLSSHCSFSSGPPGSMGTRSCSVSMLGGG